MFSKKYQFIIVILILACFASGSPLPNWSEIVIDESTMPSKGNEFTKRAYQFLKTGEYENFVTHTGVAGKTAFLEGGVLVMNNRTYLTPEFIPTNVSQVSKYDIIKVYTLFNVVYYIEQIDQDVDAILADISTPMEMETVQATILACVYNKTIIEREKFSLYIIGNPDLAKNFSFYKGQPVGSTILEDIQEGEKLPEVPPTVMIISKGVKNIGDIIKYCEENNILTITDIPKLLQKGVTVGVGTYSGELKLLLNTKGVKGSIEYWNSNNIFYKTI